MPSTRMDFKIRPDHQHAGQRVRDPRSTPRKAISGCVVANPDMAASLRKLSNGRLLARNTDVEFICSDWSIGASAMMRQAKPSPQANECLSRNAGVRVRPTRRPSGERKRLTVWSYGSVLFLSSM
jgi:hypothetical protein